jgi:hypothetical protein
MLIKSLNIPVQEFQNGTGWEIKPEGACKGDVCIPLPDRTGDDIDVTAVCNAMQLPLVEEPARGLWAIGPEYIGGRALVTAEAPELSLPGLDGKMFNLSSLRGQKVLVYAWAPY